MLRLVGNEEGERARGEREREREREEREREGREKEGVNLVSKLRCTLKSYYLLYYI